MDEPREIDWLDAKLREEASYIDDAGFSAHVVGKLPPARAPHSLRAVILIGTALLASALAYSLSGGGRFVWEAIAHASLLSPALVVGIMWVVGALFMAGSIYAALSRSDGPIG